MIIKTILLPIEKAVILQNQCSEYECTVIRSLAAENKIRVTISGKEKDVNKLLALIDE